MRPQASCSGGLWTILKEGSAPELGTPPTLPMMKIAMKTILSHCLARTAAVGPGARPPSGSVLLGGTTAFLTASSQESPGRRPQCGQSAHSPVRSRVTPRHSTRRHPGVHPGPTRLWHNTHRILSPGLCRLHRSQSGREPLALLGPVAAACAKGERHPAPVRERPSAPRSPSDHPRSIRIRAPILPACTGLSPMGTVPRASRSVGPVAIKRAPGLRSADAPGERASSASEAGLGLRDLLRLRFLHLMLRKRRIRAEAPLRGSPLLPRCTLPSD